MDTETTKFASSFYFARGALPASQPCEGAIAWDHHSHHQGLVSAAFGEHARLAELLSPEVALARASNATLLRIPLPAERDAVPRHLFLLTTADRLVTVGHLPHEHSEFVQRVGPPWVERTGNMRTAGDIALLVLDELLRRITLFRRDASRRHAVIEDAFLESVDQPPSSPLATASDLDPRGAITQLLRLNSQVSAIYRALEPVNQPGMSRSKTRVWFPEVTSAQEAEQVDDVLDRSLAGLSNLRDKIQGSIDVVASVASAEQSRRLDAFQLKLGLGGALVLWPSLVFGFYGANTRVPGQSTWSGFAVMVLIAVVGAGLLALLVVGGHRRRTRGVEYSAAGDHLRSEV